MPAYSTTAYKVTALYPGDSLTVWSAESPATNSASEQAALSEPMETQGYRVISVSGSFSGTPGTFQIDLQTSDTDADASYITLPSNAGRINAVNSGNAFNLQVQVKARFVRLFMTDDPANAVTTTAFIVG